MDMHLVAHAPWVHLYGEQSFDVPVALSTVWSSLQVAPGTHFEASHLKPPAQSVSAAHDVLQTSVPQTYGSHICVCAAGHCPLPLQLAAPVATPEAQPALRHDTLGPTNPAHLSRVVPSQLVAAHASAGAVASHGILLAAGLPETGTQVPSASMRLHASHWPLHAALQQYPSAQMPLVQELSAVHAFPLPFFGSQAPALQNAVAAQSGELVQVVWHAPAPHANGLHSVDVLWQVPAPLQVYVSAMVGAFMAQLGAPQAESLG